MVKTNVRYDCLLDYIEDMCVVIFTNTLSEETIALYLEIMEKYSANKFWVLGKHDEIEWI